MIPKCLVLCSNCLDEHTRAQALQQSQCSVWTSRICVLAWFFGNVAAIPQWERWISSVTLSWQTHGNSTEERRTHTQYGQKRRGGREEPAGRMCLFWWSRSCLSDWDFFFFFFLECGNGKGVELLEHNICTANAGIKYLDRRQEMTFAHFMMERQQQREDQIFVLWSYADVKVTGHDLTWRLADPGCLTLDDLYFFWMSFKTACKKIVCFLSTHIMRSWSLVNGLKLGNSVFEYLSFI